MTDMLMRPHPLPDNGSVLIADDLEAAIAGIADDLDRKLEPQAQVTLMIEVDVASHEHLPLDLLTRVRPPGHIHLKMLHGGHARSANEPGLLVICYGHTWNVDYFHRRTFDDRWHAAIKPVHVSSSTHEIAQTLIWDSREHGHTLDAEDAYRTAQALETTGRTPTHVTPRTHNHRNSTPTTPKATATSKRNT